MPYHDYERHLMGSAKISPKGSFEVGSMQSFQLIYTAGKFGIDEVTIQNPKEISNSKLHEKYENEKIMEIV